MKTVITLLIALFLFSCSEDECSYRGEREDEILLEMEELRAQRDTAVYKDYYQARIDMLAKELGEQLSICD